MLAGLVKDAALLRRRLTLLGHAAKRGGTIRSEAAVITIQKKLVLAPVVRKLEKHGECTRTWLRRYGRPNENYVMRALEYRLAKGILKNGSPGGYVDIFHEGKAALAEVEAAETAGLRMRLEPMRDRLPSTTGR